MFENPAIARILIRLGAELEYVTPGGWSILHYLFDRDRSTANLEFFSILLDKLLFDDVKDSEGWTALHRCAAFGTAEDINFMHLLGIPGCLDRCTTKHGWNPVHTAAVMDNVTALAALTNIYSTKQLKERSYLDILHSVDLCGWTPMHLAAERGAKATLKWLLQNGADPHRTTYVKAGWFPQGHEGMVFEVKDLAMLSGNKMFEEYVEILGEVGYDIITDGEDVYWSCDGSGN